MNKVILLGRLAKDPEVRYTQSGKAVAAFGLAINEGHGDNRRATFINIVAWDKLAEICGNNLKKGRQILCEGRLQTRSYDDKTGQKRHVTEVVMQNMEFLDSKENAGNNRSGNTPAGGIGQTVADDEDIPF